MIGLLAFFAGPFSHILMNAYERFFNLLADKPVDRLPTTPICMTFSARHAGVKYGAYIRDHRILVDTQIAMAEQFGLDVVGLISDPAREAEDCGAPVVWFDDQPTAHDANRALLGDKSKLGKLTQPDPHAGRMLDRVQGAELFRQQVGGQIPILGWVEGPMAEAADLRGMNQIMLDLVDDPVFCRDLFEFVIEMELNFARAQIEAGVDIMGIGDAAASLIGPALYHNRVYPYEKRLVDGIHAMGCPVRLHICGNVDHLLPDIAKLGVEMIDIDFLTDLKLARQILGADVAILGNFEPVRY
ncbi:MAG: uroporphyrinogen decarboxylase family protein, partial [Pirellulales bacterium]